MIDDLEANEIYEVLRCIRPRARLTLELSGERSESERNG